MNTAMKFTLLAILLAGSVGAAKPTKPNILFVLADDLGWGDLGFTGSGINTPVVDSLLAGGNGRTGNRLTHLYGQPVCSPSRTAIMTGRYPLAYGLQTYVLDPPGTDYGLNYNESTLPQILGLHGGYTTAAVGKWHMGMASWEQTPTFRGFDYFYGYHSGGQDYFTHVESGGFDLHEAIGARCGANCSRVAWEGQGQYSAELYATKAAQWLEYYAANASASQPFFMYLAFQSVHAPAEVPPQYIAPYANKWADNPQRRTFAGMVSALDEAVGNVTRALKALGLADNTLVVFAADNGGPIFGGDDAGSTNYPLRGGKHSLWEGGTRLTALVNAPQGWLAAPSGANVTGLMHHTDWLPTLLEAANVTSYTPNPALPLHGSSKWGMLARGEPSDRTEVLYNIDPCQPAAIDPGVQPGAGNAAIRIGDWKLQVGLTGPPWGWPSPDAAVPPAALAAIVDADGITKPDTVATCGAPGHLWPLSNMTAQLFNVSDEADPYERDDVSKEHPDVVAQLLARLEYWGTQVQVPPYWPTATVDPRSNPNLHNGTWVPWLD